MQGVATVLDAFNRLYCDYARSMFSYCSINCGGLRGMEGMRWFYGPGACIGCHTSIHITDVLPLKGQLSRYKAIIWSYVRAAPLRRNLRAISFITHLTIPHHTYKSAPSTFADLRLGRPRSASTLLRRPEGLSSLLYR